MAAVERVVLQHNSLGFFADANAGFLFSGGSAFEADIFDEDILRFALDIDADAGFVTAGIANDAVFDFVAMSAAKFGLLIAEQDADGAIPFEGAFPDDVIGVAM